MRPCTMADQSEKRRAIMPGAALLAVAAALTAPTPVSPAPAAGTSEKEALARVRKMIRAYRSLSAFEETANQSMQAVSGLDRQQTRFSTSFVFRRPNRFHYRLKDRARTVAIVCNGKRLWIYSSLEGKYTVQNAPSTMREMTALLGVWAPPAIEGFAFLRNDEPFGEVTAGRLVGRAKLAGELVDVVELQGSPPEMRQAGCKTLLYIGRKDDLLRKCEIRLTRASPPTQVGGAPLRMQMTISRTLRLEKAGQPVSDNAFRFQPPAGAREVDSF